MNRFSNLAVGIALIHSLCIEMLSEKRQIARIVVLPELIKSFFTHNLDHFHQGRSIYCSHHNQNIERRKGINFCLFSILIQITSTQTHVCVPYMSEYYTIVLASRLQEALEMGTHQILEEAEGMSCFHPPLPAISLCEDPRELQN